MCLEDCIGTLIDEAEFGPSPNDIELIGYNVRLLDDRIFIIYHEFDTRESVKLTEDILAFEVMIGTGYRQHPATSYCSLWYKNGREAFLQLVNNLAHTTVVEEIR